MIGIDTNILVRYFTQDDLVQSKVATEFLEEGLRSDTGYVSLIVIAELAWTLTSVFKVDKMKLVEIMNKLLAADELHIEKIEVFAFTLRRFEKTAAQFTDVLIAVAARYAGCSETFTFDEGAAKRAGMRLLT